MQHLALAVSRWAKISPSIYTAVVALVAGYLTFCADTIAFTADTAAPLTDEQRQIFEKSAAELQQLLGQHTPASSADISAIDLWADADLFRRAVRWGLDYDTDFTENDRQTLHNVLEAGLKRANALADGESPWRTQTGKLIRGFRSDVDGSVQPYGVIVPSTYDQRKPTPLHVVLHGSTRPVGTVESRFIQRFLSEDPVPDVGYIELHPLGRVENCYRWSGETDVFEAIEAACRQYNIDRDRIVLRGMSMGASGTWHLGLKHPDKFVALGPYCGYVDTRQFSRTPTLPHFVIVDELPDYQDRALHMLDSVDYAANAGVVPAIAAMGEKDIFFDAHVLMGQAFSREGLTLNNLISPGTGHTIDPKVHAEQLGQIQVHVEQGLNHVPATLRFVTWTLKYNRCHWLELLRLHQHYDRTEFEAELPNDEHPQTLVVKKVLNVDRFAIETSRLPKPFAMVQIDGKKLPVKMMPRMILTRNENGWKQLDENDPVLSAGKRPGLQGPIDDAFTSRFLCVRGTGKAWHPETQAWADARLDQFAKTWRKYFRGDLPLKNDVDVTEDEAANCHLILFGDPGSNSWIAKALPKLPMTWTEETIQLGSLSVNAREHVPVLINPSPFAPAGKHYVVLNTGHSFGEAEIAAVNYLLFPRLGDWAILKSDIELVNKTDAKLFVDPAVVECGYFDEDWRLILSP